MVLNDVWRTIGSEVGFYYEANFGDVPSSPGVYAWFYPLRVLSRSQEGLWQLVANVQSLLNYDAGDNGPPRAAAVFPFAWWSLSLAAGRTPKPLQLTEPFKRAWTEIIRSDETFTDFQRSLLKASIFMPPLYVGKADVLSVRCGQHLSGAQGANDFHTRFEGFARQLNLPLRTVRQLIFACVRTGSATEAGVNASFSPVHELVEGIMKSICAPPFGLR